MLRAALVALLLVCSVPAAAFQSAIGGIAAPTSYFGTAYYVANAGNDSHNGLSPATAWQTLAKVNGFTFASGDAVLFNGGDTFSGTLTIGVSNWTSSFAHPLTIGTYGAGTPTINSGAANGLTATNVGNIVVNGPSFTGSGISANNIYGMLFQNTNSSPVNLPQVIIENSTVSGYGNSCVEFLGAASNAGFNNPIVAGNALSNCAGNGAAASGGITFDQLGGAFNTAHANVIVQGNAISNISGSAGGGGYGITVGHTATALITHNYVNHVGYGFSAGGGGPVGIIAGNNASNVTMNYNEVKDVETTGTDGEGLDADAGCSGCIIEYNYVHDCFGAGLMVFSFSPLSTSATIRYNISQNNGRGPSNIPGEIALQDFGGSLSANVYNNTSYNNNRGAVVNLFGAITATLANNIFFGDSASSQYMIYGPSASGAIAFNGNDYFMTNAANIIIDFGGSFTGSGAYAAWRGSTGQETIGGLDSGHTSNPSLTSPGGGGTYGGYSSPQPTAYALLGGSPMKAVGLNLTTQFGIDPGSLDYYGARIPNSGGGTGFSVGADGAP